MKRPLSALTALAISVSVAACNEQALVPAGAGISGTWVYSVDVNVANGVCAGEENDPIAVDTAVIVQAGASVTITAPWGSNSGSEALLGNRVGDVVTVAGSYGEGSGTTTTTHTLNVTNSDNSMTGTETWSWTGPSGSCLASSSLLSATRIN